jgi:hypothetical protein
LGIIALDFRLIEIESELFVLDDHLNLIEEQIRNKESFERMKSQQKIKKLNLNPDDPEWHEEQQKLDYLVDFLLPRLFRGPFLISLYAVFESAVTEIASLIQKQKRITISINDLRGDFLDRAKKYFKDIVDFQLLSDKLAWDRITILSVLRNAIAHANGRIEMLNKETKQKITNLEKHKVGISSIYGFIVFEEGFLRDTLRLVSASLNDLVERYKKWDDNQRTQAGKPVPPTTKFPPP